MLRDIQETTDRFGPFPDMEFFVSSGDFTGLFERSSDGTGIPGFSQSSTKRGYDLVLPEWAVMAETQGYPLTLVRGWAKLCIFND